VSTPPQPSEDGEVLQKTAEAFDAILLKIVTEGQTVLDDEGNVQKIDPTAATLNVIRQRLKDAGISGTAPNSKTRGLGAVRERLRQQGKLRLAGDGKLPPVGEGEDAASEAV
jgi:hypothetical protein